MITFTDKQTLAITAARIAGLLRALYHETEFVDTPAQILFETEYYPLYAQLQDIAFDRKGDIKWLLLNAIENTNDKYRDIECYKTDLGIGIQIRKTVRIEVASRREALRPGKEVAFDFPSEIRIKMAEAA